MTTIIQYIYLYSILVIPQSTTSLIGISEYSLLILKKRIHSKYHVNIYVDR